MHAVCFCILQWGNCHWTSIDEILCLKHTCQSVVVNNIILFLFWQHWKTHFSILRDLHTLPLWRLILGQPTVDLHFLSLRTKEKTTSLWTWTGWMNRVAEQAKLQHVCCSNPICHLTHLDMMLSRSMPLYKERAKKRNTSFLFFLKWLCIVMKWELLQFLIGHFRVLFCFCCKTNLIASPFIRNWLMQAF